ncbi:MAG TPA: sensor histidine kinase [Candidatus Lachnoclostridium pullistercoris]|uniref:Sensor histidine kinase n=1 Tax=Candidatus Lachnoclostridium pullistercoris TaxID=2838632 RepID=A0A9D2T514_9FIRM|nr:sensor histidine kinase [Candidatus Lachnoclostridium pullistercoris]
MKKQGEKTWTRHLFFRAAVLAAAGAALITLLLAAGFLSGVSGRFYPWLWAAGAAAFLLLLWVGAVWLVRPYLRMEQTMRLFLEGYTTGKLTDFMDVTAGPAEELFLERMDRIMDSSELLKLSKRQAQYLALQNQINPHFLYNTLESIRSEALIAGLDRVADMTEALASFFRYTISKVENLVSVEEELHNCETYFRIQRYRFGNRLELAIQWDPEDEEEIRRCRIPKLTMQPILENSIIHGTELKIGAGHLLIRLELTGKCLLIRISDDGVGMSPETLKKMNERLEKSGLALADRTSEPEGGIALVNVNNRIRLLFGEEYGLHVFSMAGTGTDVEILLPAIDSDREPARRALS